MERLDGDVGAHVSFDQVLLVGDQEELHWGKPVLDGARVVGTIEEQGKADKVIVFKFKRRKMYRKKQGHRQPYTRVRVDGIEVGKPKAGKKTQEPAVRTAKEAVTEAAVQPAKAAKPAKKIAAAEKGATGVKKTAKKVGEKAPKKTKAVSPKKAAKTSKTKTQAPKTKTKVKSAPKATKKKTTKPTKKQ